LLGESKTGRDHLVEHAGVLSLRQGQWKYIEPGDGPKVNRNTNTELGNDPAEQLYNLADDLGETNNRATEHPKRVKEMSARLLKLREQGRSQR
jgi:arylsulfatase A-like enzyme